VEYIYQEDRIFSINDDGQLLAEVTFPARDISRVNIDHVYVDESLRGQGIASKIMLEAYKYLKEKDLKIVAKCPYAINWFKKHEEYQDIVINVKTKK
jgi:uncharacterized protein